MNDDLLGVAFGSRPGARARLRHTPSGPDALDSWMNAVALGARGFYAGASAQLDRIPATTTDLAVRSLACSTRASHLRQGGAHATATRYDGEALRVITGARPDPVARAATLDALIGLAADNLGTGRLDLADRLLQRAAAELDRHDDDAPWVWTGRPRLRHAWVRTELSLYRGDARSARSYAQECERLVVDCPSVRHRLKTDLIIAASHAAAGDTVEATRLATACVATARTHGQVPLEWAATSLLIGVGGAGPADDAAGVVADEARLRAELRGRGGAFSAG